MPTPGRRCPARSLPGQQTRSLRRKVTRDLLSRLMTVDFPRWTGETELTDINRTFVSQANCRYTIIEGDPLSSTIETDYRVTLKRPDTSVTHHSVGRMTCDAAHFRIEVTLDVYENEKKIFTRNWDQKIKRDFM